MSEHLANFPGILRLTYNCNVLRPSKQFLPTLDFNPGQSFELFLGKKNALYEYLCM